MSTPELLLERTAELDVLDTAVAQLGAGRGSVVLVESEAGLGKTALLAHAAASARAAGHRVRDAAPPATGRNDILGVIRELLELPFEPGAPGAAARAALLEEISCASPAVGTGLVELCAELTSERPLVLVVDNADQADAASLAALAHLARRAADLRVLLLVAHRTGDPRAAADCLALLAATPGAITLRPATLSAVASAELLRRAAPNASDADCDTCHVRAGGRPWLLCELGDLLARHGSAALDPQSPESGQVIHGEGVRRRVAAVAAGDRAVLEAVALIGDEPASPQIIASAAGVSVPEYAASRDALVAEGLLQADGEHLVHWLVGLAVTAGLSRSRSEQLHRAVARAFCNNGGAARVIGEHLLWTIASAEPAVSASLLRAATDAAQRGDSEAAVRYLERALLERAEGDDRGRILAQLATVAFDAGRDDAPERLREALAEVHDDGPCRISILARLAAFNLLERGDQAVAEQIEQELVVEAEPGADLAVEAAALDMLITAPNRHRERAERAAAIEIDFDRDNVMSRVVLAHRAWLAAETGTPDAASTAALALEALEDDTLLSEATRRTAYHLCVLALLVSDDHDATRRAITRMREEALARGSAPLRAAAAWYASELALRTGRIDDAEREARNALEVCGDDPNLFSGSAAAVLATALAERGAFADAHAALDAAGPGGPYEARSWTLGLREARARVWLIEGAFEQAYAEATAVGVFRHEHGRPNPATSPWRAIAATALAHMGRHAEAARFADEELTLACRFGAPVPIAGARLARALATVDQTERIIRCEEALALGAAGLEAVRLRLELGAAHARLGAKTVAREPLRRARADADALGATL
ncbi:MAG: AAA family ATPase, partial [Solirubrobacteraceae bacterium]